MVAPGQFGHQPFLRPIQPHSRHGAIYHRPGPHHERRWRRHRRAQPSHNRRLVESRSVWSRLGSVVTFVRQSLAQVDRNVYYLVLRLLTNTSLSFIACIVFSPPVRPHTALGCACAVYMCYLLISLVPLITVAASGGSDNDRKWFDAMFVGLHIIFVNPCVTILGVISVYPQARAIFGRPRGESALSLVGLAAQAVVFLLLGLTWSARFEGWHYPIFGRGFYSWFQMVGYVPFDHLVFAVAQAVLLYIAVRHSGWPVRVDEARPPSETDPLL